MAGIRADDTNAIQAAEDAVPQSGGTVILPKTSACYAVQKLYVNAPTHFVFQSSCVVAFGNAAGITNPVFNSYPGLTNQVSSYSIEGVGSFEAQPGKPVGIWFDTQNTKSFTLHGEYPDAITASGFEVTTVRVTQFVTSTVSIENMNAECGSELSTTLMRPILSTGARTIAIGNTRGLVPGAIVQIESQTSSTYEDVIVTSVSNGNEFIASVRMPHPVGSIVAWNPNMGVSIGVAGTSVTNARVIGNTFHQCGNTVLGYQAAPVTMSSKSPSSGDIENNNAFACNGSCLTIAFANVPGSHSIVRGNQVHVSPNPIGAAFGSDCIDIGPSVRNVDVENNYCGGSGVGGAVGIAVENIAGDQETSDITLRKNTVENVTGPGITIGDGINGSTVSHVFAGQNTIRSAGASLDGAYSSGFFVNAEDVVLDDNEIDRSLSAYNYGIDEGLKVTAEDANRYDGNHITGYMIKAVLRNGPQS